MRPDRIRLAVKRWLHNGAPWGLRILGLTAGFVLLSSAIERQPQYPAPAIAEKQDEVRRYRIEPGSKSLLAADAHGQTINSVLNIRKQMHYGEFVWDDKNVPQGNIWIRIDLASQMMSVFRGGDEIGTAVIMYGGDNKPTPVGQFSVLWKRQDHRSSLYDAPMPYTLRLTHDGVAIHGADVREKSATNGCVSVPVEFAELLFGQTPVGAPVTILSS